MIVFLLSEPLHYLFMLLKHYLLLFLKASVYTYKKHGLDPAPTEVPISALPLFLYVLRFYQLDSLCVSTPSCAHTTAQKAPLYQP